MSRYSKAPTGGGVARASQSIQHRHTYTIKTSPKDQPGTALTAYTSRYKFDLLLLPYTPKISRLIEACDILLDEADRGSE